MQNNKKAPEKKTEILCLCDIQAFCGNVCLKVCSYMLYVGIAYTTNDVHVICFQCENSLDVCTFE